MLAAQRGGNLSPRRLASPQDRQDPFRYLTWDRSPRCAPLLAPRAAASRRSRSVLTALAMDHAVTHDHHDARSRETAAPRHGSWPVLAELPRIDGDVEPQNSRRYVVRESAAPTARSADERSPRTNRYVVDARHPQGGETPPVQPEQRRTPRLRVDLPTGHRPAAHARTTAEPPTFSAQMFRLHESLAPHMGLVGAAALVIAGSLLYWLAFAQSGIAIGPNDLGEIRSDWSHDSAPHEATPSVAPASPSVTKEPAQAAGWTAPPRVASAPPAASDGSAAGPPAIEALPAPELVPPGEAPVPLPPVDESTPTTTLNDRGVSPTPTAICPTTPYPAYATGTGIGTAAMRGPGLSQQPGPLGSTVSSAR
jgi:hypothetical protein